MRFSDGGRRGLLRSRGQGEHVAAELYRSLRAFPFFHSPDREQVYLSLSLSLSLPLPPRHGLLQGLVRVRDFLQPTGTPMSKQ